ARSLTRRGYALSIGSRCGGANERSLYSPPVLPSLPPEKRPTAARLKREPRVVSCTAPSHQRTTQSEENAMKSVSTIRKTALAAAAALVFTVGALPNALAHRQVVTPPSKSEPVVDKPISNPWAQAHCNAAAP